MRRLTHREGFSLLLGAALMLAVAVASPATAAKFAMSGTWLIRNGQAFIPLQFDNGITQVNCAGGPCGFPKDMLHITSGNPFATTPMTLPGTTQTWVGAATDAAQQGIWTGRAVFQTGVAPQTIQIPRNRLTGMKQNAIPLVGANLKQITSHFSIFGPFEDATLMKSGGPGAFTWCWNDPTCNGMGKPNKGNNAGGTVTPNQATRGGRIIYQPGTNRFGGTMRFGVASGGLVSVPRTGVPGLFLHFTFGGVGTTNRNLAPGGPYAATEMAWLGRGRGTRNFNPQTTPGFINGAGFFLVGMTTLTNGKMAFASGTMPANCAVGACATVTGLTLSMPAGMIHRFTAIGSAPASRMLSGNRAGQITTNFGFPHTTGNVFAQQTTGSGGADFFSAMGDDNRNGAGIGNITTVTAGLSRRNTLGGRPRYAVIHKVSMEIAPFVPSMSPAGFAAAGVLMLLSVGYMLRRRIG